MFNIESTDSSAAVAVGYHTFEPHTSRIIAAYICKRCDIEGQDPELSPGRAYCWNCKDEAMITARIIIPGA